MKLADIHIRDPYILPEGGKYYLYGTRGPETWTTATGLDVYVSDDLENWSEAREVFTKPQNFWADRNFWAPEVHKYRGKFYMFATFKNQEQCRGTQILVSGSPMGPFVPHSDGPVTPRDWECLDGTLYIDPSGTPYMVFCREWLQVGDGEIHAMELTPDLKAAAGAPIPLFRGSEPSWAPKDSPTFITDGPFLYHTAAGRLLMLWSSSIADSYVEAIAYADSGEIAGPWRHCRQPLYNKDGGHGMLFTSNEGQLLFIMHWPNQTPLERPVLRRMEERDGMLYLAP